MVYLLTSYQMTTLAYRLECNTIFIVDVACVDSLGKSFTEFLIKNKILMTVNWNFEHDGEMCMHICVVCAIFIFSLWSHCWRNWPRAFSILGQMRMVTINLNYT